jgi:uncharacterized protein (TIGR02217 family)
MTQPPMFPALRGQFFPKPVAIWGGDRLLESVSGREMRARRWKYPRYAFDIPYEAVCADDSHPGVTPRSMQMLVDLYHRCGGRVGTFLFKHPDDCYVTGQVVGTGNGATTSFKFQRTLVSFVEPVCWVLSVEAVYLDGVQTEDGWSLTEPNSLVFTTAPASGVVITADFVFAFECRFDMNELEFEGFAHRLYSVGTVRFKSVRAK